MERVRESCGGRGYQEGKWWHVQLCAVYRLGIQYGLETTVIEHWFSGNNDWMLNFALTFRRWYRAQPGELYQHG